MLLTIRGEMMMMMRKEEFLSHHVGSYISRNLSFLFSLSFFCVFSSPTTNDLQVELIIFGNFRPFHEQLAALFGKNRVKSKIKKIIFSEELRIQPEINNPAF